MLLAAVGPWPYSFYTLLRWVVCGTVLVLAYEEFKVRGEASAWVVALGGIGVLFNPLFPVSLTREIWAPIDVGAAIVLLVHRAQYKRRAPTRSTTTQSAGLSEGSDRVGAAVHNPAFGPQQLEAGVSVERNADSTALPPGTQLRGCEILRVLGAGGFGITYLAFDHALNCPVAVKEYFYAGLAARASGGVVASSAPSSAEPFEWGRDRFLDEARLLARLDHPNVARIHRYFEANNTAYIVMDYLEGESLAEVIEKHGKLTTEQWWVWMQPLLAGLEHVHGHNYLHLDIKPANIVIRTDQAGWTMPVLVGFGAARRAAAEKTRHLTAVHTPGYAPIEQYSSSNRQVPATDIYALAAVSYRVLSGVPPPDAADRVTEDEYQPLGTRLQRPEDQFLAAIDEALAPRAADRPQNVRAWRLLLQRGQGADGAAVRRNDLLESSEHGLREEKPMSRKPPEAQTLRISRLRQESVTSRGNHYLECLTDLGVAAFWGSDGNLDNIRRIKSWSSRIPFTVTCRCIPSNWSQHVLWIPEDSRLDLE